MYGTARRWGQRRHSASWMAPPAACSPASAPRSIFCRLCPGPPAARAATLRPWPAPARGGEATPKSSRASETRKKNHVAAAGSIAAAVAGARRLTPTAPLEVEVENLAELQQALAAGVGRILLDNFSLDQLRHAVRLTTCRAALEASGGIRLDNIRAVAETGVDFISVGDITKDVEAVDLSMRFTAR